MARIVLLYLEKKMYRQIRTLIEQRKHLYRPDMERSDTSVVVAAGAIM